VLACIFHFEKPCKQAVQLLRRHHRLDANNSISPVAIEDVEARLLEGRPEPHDLLQLAAHYVEVRSTNATHHLSFSRTGCCKLKVL
jgi:hypothetical protein